MGDRRICQTFAASPAEPGGLPLMLAVHSPTEMANATAALLNLAAAGSNCASRSVNDLAATAGMARENVAGL
jgi:hypothetical protein